MPHFSFTKPLVWALFFITQLLATALIAWHLLAQWSFGYPWGYQLLHLDVHIAELAPVNRYKQGFEYTTPKDHWKLFSEISRSVQHQGEGLDKISYSTPSNPNIPLMHQAEITHLQDVAALIDKFYLTGFVAGGLFLFVFFYMKKNQWHYPPVKKIAAGFSIGILMLTGLLLILGPVTVFYWFHTQIFPEGHQWFFYYEESLMTTLMKAPDIFAFIGLELLFLWVLLIGMTNTLTIKLLNTQKPL